MKDLILVYYIGVGNINDYEVIEFIEKVTERIMLNNFSGEIIVIPTNEVNTRVECINPKYITEPELINEHKIMFDRLLIELQKQIEIINKKRNG